MGRHTAGRWVGWRCRCRCCCAELLAGNRPGPTRVRWPRRLSQVQRAASATAITREPSTTREPRHSVGRQGGHKCACRGVTYAGCYVNKWHIQRPVARPWYQVHRRYMRRQHLRPLPLTGSGVGSVHTPIDCRRHQQTVQQSCVCRIGELMHRSQLEQSSELRTLSCGIMRRHATLLLVRGRWCSEGEPWGDDLTDGEVPSLHAGLRLVRLHRVVKAPKPQQRLLAFAGLPSWSVLAELVAAGNG